LEFGMLIVSAILASSIAFSPDACEYVLKLIKIRGVLIDV